MKLLSYGKDGGQDSTVWGFWLIEAKRLLSIALLCFENGSREAYHSHAFNSVSWVLWGKLEEDVKVTSQLGYTQHYSPSFRPIITKRTTLHKVTSRGRTWVVTFRGPWADRWVELRNNNRFVALTYGRAESPVSIGDVVRWV